MNIGFSAPVNYWGTIVGLTPKSSNRPGTQMVVTAQDAMNDVIAFDRFGGVLNPVVEYAVTAAFANANNVLALGKVFTYENGGVSTKIMMTEVAVRTSAGNPPTVTISGVQVEPEASTKRTYPITLNLSPRSKAQDVAGAFTLSGNVYFQSVDTVYAVDPIVQTRHGWPVVHDLANGRVDVNATFVQPAGGGTWGKSDGFDVFMTGDENRQDAEYVTRNISSIKYLTGTDVTQS